ncbi:ABC transporter ATP-binding protein [Acetobacterium tundrae]|uniref:ATP-binding cassette domain-containing protein n=1 Tax=Acetobacterium tundrae TaxID=132932 RepID=A0ABR6WJX5_9FIRM|nr:ABC transporter ATP-binding protein [Acetobacterium tundrae]MBC3796817.1 ATP-binding cassette domain-containing protein [Acetobacterium tundrae]
MKNLINVQHLEKSYKNKKVIHDLSFQVAKGEILCFLGPNGAGKSTTINILTGALGFDSGKIDYCGQSIHKNLGGFKRKLGVVPQDLAVYEDLSGKQNVEFFASLYGLKGDKLRRQSHEALAFTGLLEKSEDKVDTYSGGMKRRLNIACAIAHQPDLLIMDEPTVGIDPQSRNHILSSIKKLRDRGMTILYTTHYMEEVEEISTRIIIMDKGELVASGTKERLKESIENEKQYWIDIENPERISADLFYQIEGVKAVIIEGKKIGVTSLKGIENLDRIITVLINIAAKIKGISCESASLETVFLDLTGKSLRD